MLRGFLSSCAPLYCLGLEAYLLPYNLGLRKRTRLPCPVICIGNLTTGGTGKTPMTETLCRHLQSLGKKVVILSRGYGGKNEYGCAVVSDGEKVLLTAVEAGDEAYLLAASLSDIPVIVGKDRRVTGSLGCERFQPDVIVLDDGMQFWQLHRDLDIVLLNACEPFDNGWTFPRGLLREPPSHLRRAGIVVLTNSRRAGSEQVACVTARIERLAPGVPVFTADLDPCALGNVFDGADVDGVHYSLEWLKGKSIAALSALGNPAGFEAMLRELGAMIVLTARFRDHQPLTAADLTRVSSEALEAGVEAIITTMKDGVKIEPIPLRLPLLMLRVLMQIENESAFLDAVQDKTFRS